jgi:hypothetical protein
VVRRLSPSGGPSQTVATLPPFPSADPVAFAVSPDGGRVIASVLAPPAPPGRSGHVDIDLSVAGGPPATVRRIVVPAGATTALRVVGWDAVAPVVVPDGPTTPPADPHGGELWRGHPAHADLRGAVGPPLGDAACTMSGEQPEGDLLCVGPDGAGGYAASVYGERQLLHRFAGVGAVPFLAPGEERIAFASDAGRAAIEGIDGRTALLPVAAGVPAGWLDAATVIGSNAGRLTSVAVFPTGPVVELGVSGDVVGVIR